MDWLTVITCKRGSAKHSVKDDHALIPMGTCDFQVSPQPKPLNRSRWNFARLITSASLRDVPKMVLIGWLGAAPQIGEIQPQNSYNTLLYLFLFLYASTAQTAEPICTHNGSNDAVCCKEVPFGGRVDTKLHLGVKTPENPKFWNRGAKFPAKSIHSNNF